MPFLTQKKHASGVKFGLDSHGFYYAFHYSYFRPEPKLFSFECFHCPWCILHSAVGAGIPCSGEVSGYSQNGNSVPHKDYPLSFNLDVFD